MTGANMATEMTPGLPKKVLLKAHEYGLHNDCVAADFKGACDVCREHMHLAMNFYYGDCDSPEEVVRRIIADMLGEL